MNFESLKKSIREIELKSYDKTKKNKLVEDCSGYYVLPCTKEPFRGDVIELSGDEFYIFFQKYSNTDEQSFRNKLESMDAWFFDKPHRVQKNWMDYIAKWLGDTK